MPKYKLTIQVVQEPVIGTCTVEADDLDSAEDVAQMLFDNDSDEITWDYCEDLDLSKTDLVEIVHHKVLDE